MKQVKKTSRLSNALGYGAVRSSLRKQTGRRQAAEQLTATCGGNALHPAMRKPQEPYGSFCKEIIN